MKIEVKLTEEQTKDMKEAFDLFDPDETGTIAVNGIMVSSWFSVVWIGCLSVHIFSRFTNTSITGTQQHEMCCVSVLQVAVRALGLQVEKDEIQKMIPVSGKIDFGDFLRVMTQEMVRVIQLVPGNLQEI